MSWPSPRVGFGLSLMVGFVMSALLTHLPVDAQTPKFQAQSPVAAAPAAQSATDKSDAEYKKLSKAILTIYKRVALAEQKNVKQEQAIKELKADNADLKQQLATIKNDSNFNRSAIATLHQRLTYLDGRGGTISIPNSQP